MGIFFKEKLLVVEDAEPLSHALLKKLSRSGFRVLVASNYDEAVQLLNTEQKIKAVWLDHYLKGEQNGLEVLRYIREESDSKDLPVFLVTASNPVEVHHYRELGIARSYVKSDFQMETIIDDIRKVLKDKSN